MKVINGDTGKRIVRKRWLATLEGVEDVDATALAHADDPSDIQTYGNYDEVTHLMVVFIDEDGNECSDDTLECVDDEDDEALRRRCDGDGHDDQELNREPRVYK